MVVHGLSWTGKHGRGFVLDSLADNPKTVVTVGLAKGWGTGGGVITCPNKQLADRVKYCGPTLTFAAPLQPPVVGAAIASAKIHLSDEIITKQKKLKELNQYLNQALEKQGIDMNPYSSIRYLIAEIHVSNSTIKFIILGSKEKTQEAIMKLLERGFYINPAHFPAVGIKESGLRFLVNLAHEKQDLLALAEALGEIVGPFFENIDVRKKHQPIPLEHDIKISQNH